MSNVGLPDDVVDAMYQRAITHPARGRRRDGLPTSRNISGLTGAYQKRSRGKWYSRIMINGEVIKLKNREGKTYFHSAEEAHNAYIEAAIEAGII